jgi:hypothetical protein
MSQPNFQGGMPAPNDKPAAITVFGILHLVFGAFGLCGVGAGIFGMIVLTANPGIQQAPNPVLDHPIGFAWNIASLGIGSVTTFMLIAAGILLLMNKELGRVLTIYYGWISIGFGIVGMVVMAIIMISVMGQANGQGPEQMAATFGMIGGACGGLIGMIYPGLAIYFMTQGNVIAYLKRFG